MLRFLSSVWCFQPILLRQNNSVSIFCSGGKKWIRARRASHIRLALFEWCNCTRTVNWHCDQIKRVFIHRHRHRPILPTLPIHTKQPDKLPYKCVNRVQTESAVKCVRLVVSREKKTACRHYVRIQIRNSDKIGVAKNKRSTNDGLSSSLQPLRSNLPAILSFHSLAYAALTH